MAYKVRFVEPDTQWQRLMSLCASESKFKSEGNHPRLLKLLQSTRPCAEREEGTRTTTMANTRKQLRRFKFVGISLV